jgi:hypothetical protein
MKSWQKHHRRLRIPAGSLLIWNSRTVHTGCVGTRRFAQAVCLEPSSARPAAQRYSKMRLAALGLPSTHWARIGHQHDVLPTYKGFLATSPASDACGADTPSDVRLPLRPAIRPEPLAADADLEALRPLAHVDWSTCEHFCVWEPPPGSAALLEASVSDDFKPYL